MAALSTSWADGQVIHGTDIDAITGQINTTTQRVTNVKDFGAIGNGATDDTVAFQAAVTAATAGGIIYAPPATYMLNGLFLKSNVTLRGAGMGATILKFNASGANTWVVRVSADSTTAGSYTGLEQLTIDGNMSAVGSGDVNKRYGYYLGVNPPTVVTDCWVDRVEFRACKAYALDVLDVSRITVTNCVSHDNGFSTGTNNNCSGFETHGNDVLVANCQAYGNSNYGFFAGNGEAHTRIRIIDCNATTSGQGGFLIGDTLTDSAVIGCTGYGNTKWGVSIGPGADRTIVSGCSFSGNAFQGIDVYNSNNCVLVGNQLNGNSSGGFDDEIKIEGTSTSTLVSGNQITTLSTNRAVKEYDTANGTLLAGNLVNRPLVLIGANSGTKRITTLTSTATPAINTDLFDEVNIPALATAITSFTMTGTPISGQELWIAITGTAARAIAWGTSFEGSTGAPLPTTTVTTLRLDVRFKWNTVTSKWRCVGVA